MKAQSDIGILLYVKSTTYGELIEIKSVPATGGEPETLDATTLKDSITSNIAGRQSLSNLSFTYNYTEDNYDDVEALCDGVAHEFLVKYQDGTGFYFKGTVNTWVNEVSVNSVVEATMVVTPSEVEHKTSAEVTAMLPASI